MIKKFLETGKIVGTHGVRGMVRVQPWSDSGDFLCGFKYFYLDPDGREKLEAAAVRPHGAVVLIAFKGTDSIEKAEKLRNRTVYIDRYDASLPEGTEILLAEGSVRWEGEHLVLPPQSGAILRLLGPGGKGDDN